MSFALTSNFLLNARGVTYADGGGLTWSFNKNTNTITAVATGSVSGANPTAKVGLAAVSGSAATFMRSDGAPPIDQTITPTWTGLHTFTGGVTISGTLTIDTFTLALTGNASLSGTNTGDQVIPTAHNPAAVVGLAAVNGTATTFMRSDGAPALDQTIGPTWSGSHKFTAGPVIQGDLTVLQFNNSAPTVVGQIGSVKGWVGSGTDTTDFAIGAIKALNLYVNGGTTPAVAIATTGAVTLAGNLAVNGGTPTAALSGFGSPSGTPTASLTSASTLAQTAGTLAALLAYLKTIGIVTT